MTRKVDLGEKEQGSHYNICTEGALPPDLINSDNESKKMSAIEFEKILRLRIDSKYTCICLEFLKVIIAHNFNGLSETQII